MVVVLFPHWLPGSARHVYFEASAMIIALINLGSGSGVKSPGQSQ